MSYTDMMAAVECMLFVAGDPVPIIELQRVLNMTQLELKPLLYEMEQAYENENRGLRLLVTDQTVQLTSNRELAQYVEALMQPAQSRTFSQSLLETLAVIAYRQPVTRADVEMVRGVRCEYAVSQLVKLNMIESVGRKDCVGRPMMYATTDGFLRQFGLHHVNELPNFEAYAKGEIEMVAGDVLTV